MRVAMLRYGGFLLSLCCLMVPFRSTCAQTLTEKLKSESLAELASAVRKDGDPIRGAILFSQQKLGCVNCHATGNDALLGPDLTRSDEKISDAEFVESLLFPSKRIRKGYETVTVITKAGKSFTGRIIERTPQKLILRDISPERRLLTFSETDLEEVSPNKISSMPEKLTDQLQSRQEFLDLVRYVMEIAATGSGAVNHASGGGEIAPELQGLVLMKEFNCAACHQDDVSNVELSVKQAPVLSWSARRINPGYIERYLADPIHVKPGTTMPDVLSSLPMKERSRIAREMTHYLASQAEAPFAIQPVDPESAARGRELFHNIGCVACHSPRDERGEELLKDSSVPLGRLEEKYNIDGLAEFLKAPHEVRPSGRMPDMKLTHWEALDLSHYLTQSRETQSKATTEFKLIPTLAAKGRLAFHQRQCVQCHSVPGQSHSGISRPLSAVRSERGCLSEKPGDWPQFDLNETQRKALRAALARTEKSVSDEDQIAITLTGMRCLNCHQRGELGGVSSERNPHFHTTNPNLGPQGRIPPTLTNVGAKLNPQWMRQVLVNGRAIRPYLLTRMPQYGSDNVEHLVDLLQQVDELPEVPFAEFEDLKVMRTAGFDMAGTGGLNCIACHTFQLKQAAAMPAVDLTEMAERLQKTWFYHYMKNPQQLSANTVMPSFWPGGHAIRKEILDGDPDLQIEALWQYLLDGRQARQPRGLIIEPIELLATDEAVMLRRSYPGVGKRGIGVGYPLNVNLVFDAEQMRVALLWQGDFADPGGVWRSQGHGRVRPLSREVIEFAKGPDLDDAESPWVVDESRPPQHHFRGYRLDKKRRPAFMYEYDGVAIVDRFTDVPDETSNKPFLQRTLTVEATERRNGLRLRVATGKEIIDQGDGVFLIDNKLTVRVTGTTEILTSVESGKELILPLDIPEGTSSTIVDYRWPTSNSSK